MELRDQDISLKALLHTLPLLDRLHDCGTARDSAGNRTLFFDDYAKLVLVYLFNPLIDSISMLQRAAGLPKLAKKLGIAAFSKASFSEAPAVFDPAMLQAVVLELAGELRALPADPRLRDINKIISLADGTLLKTLPKLVETLYRANKDDSTYHAFRIHAIINLKTSLPEMMHVTGGCPRGPDNERRVLEAAAQSGHLYVADRGYFDKKLFERIVAAGSSYVFRAPENLAYEVIEQRSLSPQSLAQGVLSDQVVHAEGLDHPLRLVTAKADVHPKRKRSGNVQSSGKMLIVSDDLVLAPELISLLYSYRWTIETFFKFLKQMLGCRHLISHRKAGVEIQIYCAMIACMLLNLSTGIKPAKAVLEILMWRQLGFADEKDVLEQIQKTRREQEKAHAKKLGL